MKTPKYTIEFSEFRTDIPDKDNMVALAWLRGVDALWPVTWDKVSRQWMFDGLTNIKPDALIGWFELPKIKFDVE